MKSMTFFRFAPFLLVLMLCSCLSEALGPDLSHYVCYQLSNNSSQEITLHFYEQESAKIVYAYTWNGVFETNVSPNDRRSVEELWSDTFLTLSENQSAMLYLYSENYNPQKLAQNVFSIGDGSYLRFFSYLQRLLGDSVVLSFENKPDSIVSLSDYSVWETWYDEKSFIYYHFWRIE